MTQHHERVQSLDLAPFDAPLRVRSIVFESVRARCSSLALEEGALARRRATLGDMVVLEVPSRGHVILERAIARFVEVEVVDDAER